MTDEPMSPGEATAKLAEMHAALHPDPPANPGTPVEASARLAFLTKDPAWREKVLAGDAATRQEMDSLTKMVAEGDPTDGILAGVVPETMVEFQTPGVASYLEMAAAVPMLRNAGLRDEVIREILTDKKVGRREHEMTRLLQAEKMGDAEWRQRLLSGDFVARRELTLMSTILSATIDESLK
jgi:hypothetical protein